MGKKLYVGNLTYGVTDSDLEQMFAPHGTVQSAQEIMDLDTGRSKGFGFVEMGSDQEVQAAIAALNGKDVGGRALTVNEAKPREDRGGGRGYGGGAAEGGPEGGAVTNRAERPHRPRPERHGRGRSVRPRAGLSARAGVPARDARKGETRPRWLRPADPPPGAARGRSTASPDRRRNQRGR